jgi:uracil-DNA glycosylase
MILLQHPKSFDEWRLDVLKLLQMNTTPNDVLWSFDDHQPNLWFDSINSDANFPLKIPARLKELLMTLSMHQSPTRWNLMYRILYRTIHGEKNLLDDPGDPDVAAALRMQYEIEKDIHRFHAFLRFKKHIDNEGEIFIAFYKPDHSILRAALQTFVERFGSMRWVIFTPECSAYWNTKTLAIQDTKIDIPQVNDQEMETLWSSYYSSVFNPTRSNEKLLKQHIPSRFRSNMPELEDVDHLLQNASKRTDHMIESAPSLAISSSVESLQDLNIQLQQCVACPIGLNGTRAVAGQGSFGGIMLIGEQPGDEEEKSGNPFVGPAGEVLNQVFHDLNLNRNMIYITNAVKHFKFVMRGKSRIHDRPSPAEIGICRSWLNEEIRFVQPPVIICLGASAAQSVLGVKLDVGKNLNKEFTHPSGAIILVTYHPAAILRVPDPDRKREMYSQILRSLANAQARSIFKSGKQYGEEKESTMG